MVVMIFLTLPLMFQIRITAAQIGTPDPVIPEGFYLIDSDRGVSLYRKDYIKGNPDFVQRIDLSLGARLELMHGKITEARPTKGDYGGPDPRMTSLLMETYWYELNQIDPKAFCVTNGLFFYMPEYPTRLAFPLKINGKLVTDGWGKETYLGEQLLLELWQNHASITPLNAGSLKMSSAPNLIGGLTEEANKRAKYSVGRTFIGIDDWDSDGESEIVLILNTLTATQNAAADTLKSFGADQVIMLDGGGSTQLLCEGGAYIHSDRPVPQAIGVIAAEEPPVTSQLIGYSNWTVIVAGDQLPMEIQLENTGRLDWSPSDTAILIQSAQQNFREEQPLQHDVPSGTRTTIQSRISVGNASGVIPVLINLSIEHDGELYEADTFELQAVVLPARLRAHKSDLQAEISRWVISDPDETVRLVDGWIEEMLGKPLVAAEVFEPQELNPINPSDAALIPLLMLPALVLIAWVIARSKQ